MLLCAGGHDPVVGRAHMQRESQALKLVDQLCDQFESSWRSGGRPQIEDVLGQAAESSRRDLFRHLLELDIEYRRDRGEEPQKAEYVTRFPAYVRIIDEYLPEPTGGINARGEKPGSGGARGPRQPISPSTDRNLLFAVMALQQGLVSRDAIIAAMNSWLVEKSKSLGKILVEQGVLTERAHEEVNELVSRHVELHDNDVAASLVAIGGIGSEQTTILGQAAPFAGEDEIEDFELVRLLGQGAFAKVHLARQKSMQRTVALKISTRGSDEPRTLAQLEHPNIVRVYDQRTVPSRDLRLLYMEYVPGGTLEALIRKVSATAPDQRSGDLLLSIVDGSLEEQNEARIESATRHRLRHMPWSDVVCYLGACLAEALDYAHRKGVLHRDIKPANILLAADGSPKLADFNIAYSSKLEGITPTAYFGGSLAYMSPEQLEACHPRHTQRPEDLDGRSDVYSLGIVLWELLTGSSPFDSVPRESTWLATVEELAAQRRAALSPEALASLRQFASAGLAEVLQRSLAPRAEDRFANTAQLARQLRLCLHPQVQRLRKPRTDGWYGVIWRRPLLVVVLVALFPNLVLSVLNVAYDWIAIISEFPTVVVRVFVVLITLVKALFYLGGTVVGVWFVLPVFLAMHRPPPSDELARCRRRCLGIGNLVFWVSLSAWTLSGVVFPALIQISGESVRTRSYIHFLASHVLCGAIAGTLSFFLITFLTVRSYYPRLLDDGARGVDEAGLFNQLRRRMAAYGKIAIAVPFVAALVPLVTDKDVQFAYAGLALLGAAVLFVYFRLSREVESDLEALLLAVDPASEA
jgi:serine/threonine protein kinase